MSIFDMPTPIVIPAPHRIAPHLLNTEIRCPCGCQFGMYPGEFDQRLADNHEIVREAAGGRPLPCGSGCRCPAKNRSLWPIGAHPNSDHMKGRGMDLSCPAGMDPLDFAVMVLELYGAGKLIDITAIGLYSWGVHLSVGSKTSRPTMWGPLEDEAVAKFKANKPAPGSKPQADKPKPAKKPAKKRKD